VNVVADTSEQRRSRGRITQGGLTCQSLPDGRSRASCSSNAGGKTVEEAIESHKSNRDFDLRDSVAESRCIDRQSVKGGK
jgi:hypothetical protein